MKNVWILERWQTPEMMQEELTDALELAEDMKQAGTPDEKLEAFVEKFKQAIAENPNGRWQGFEGKSNYKAFCEVAKEALRRADKQMKFRVVKAEIKDDAKFWVGYRNAVENEGVMRYLYATK